MAAMTNATIAVATASGLRMPSRPTRDQHKLAREGLAAPLDREQHMTAVAFFTIACLTLLTAAGCSNATSASKPPQPPSVEVAEVVQKDVPIYSEWIGTLDGLVNADIKAQVSGYLVQQAYTEGTFVSKSQLLFQIDPRPFQAALAQAEAIWRRDQAQLKNCLLYTSPSPRDRQKSRMPSSA